MVRVGIKVKGREEKRKKEESGKVEEQGEWGKGRAFPPSPCLWKWPTASLIYDRWMETGADKF